MDAMEFLKEYDKMCGKETCSSCPLRDLEKGGFCKDILRKYPEASVRIIEKWSTEHPKKTKKSEFLKLFPNPRMKNGVVVICPQDVEKDFECDYKRKPCEECAKEYWLTEVE